MDALRKNAFEKHLPASNGTAELLRGDSLVQLKAKSSRPSRRSRQLVGLLGLLLVLCGIFSTAGRLWAGTSVTDGSTPLGLAPGAPAGSYPLSHLENINLFNGSLNFRLPLLQVGGRGEAGYTMTLPIEQHWRVRMESDGPGQEVYYPDPYHWGPVPRA